MYLRIESPAMTVKSFWHQRNTIGNLGHLFCDRGLSRLFFDLLLLYNHDDCFITFSLPNLHTWNSKMWIRPGVWWRKKSFIALSCSLKASQKELNFRTVCRPSRPALPPALDTLAQFAKQQDGCRLRNQLSSNPFWLRLGSETRGPFWTCASSRRCSHSRK